jgi:hypothetical protein
LYYLFKSVSGDCDLKVVQKADELKTEIEKLAQQVMYDDQGKIIKAGVNASDLKGLSVLNKVRKSQ